jgi:hypothetical protein
VAYASVATVEAALYRQTNTIHNLSAEYGAARVCSGSITETKPRFLQTALRRSQQNTPQKSFFSGHHNDLFLERLLSLRRIPFESEVGRQRFKELSEKSDKRIEEFNRRVGSFLEEMESLARREEALYVKTDKARDDAALLRESQAALEESYRKAEERHLKDPSKDSASLRDESKRLLDRNRKELLRLNQDIESMHSELSDLLIQKTARYKAYDQAANEGALWVCNETDCFFRNSFDEESKVSIESLDRVQVGGRRPASQGSKNCLDIENEETLKQFMNYLCLGVPLLTGSGPDLPRMDGSGGQPIDVSSHAMVVSGVIRGAAGPEVILRNSWGPDHPEREVRVPFSNLCHLTDSWVVMNRRPAFGESTTEMEVALTDPSGPKGKDLFLSRSSRGWIQAIPVEPPKAPEPQDQHGHSESIVDYLRKSLK